MDAVRELANEIKVRTNPAAYSPMFGKIISLPELKIQIGRNAFIYADDVKLTFDIHETRPLERGGMEYVNLGKEVVLLPYSDDNKFIAVGVVM